MTEYLFNGKWEDKLEISYLSEFRNAGGSYTGIINKENKGLVNLIIIDEWTIDPDPLPSQINAINNLIYNQKEILDSLLRHVFNEYDKIKSIYQYEEPEKSEFTPELNTPNDLKKLIGVGNVFIHTNSKNEISDIGFECGCTWDEEHGLGVRMHNTDIISIGMADEAFGSGKLENYKFPDIPIKHKPHPKYGILKPYQISENRNYENQLINKGLKDMLHTHLLNDEIDLNLKGKQLLESAIRLKKFDIAMILNKFGVDFEICMPDFIRWKYDEDHLQFFSENDININKQNGSGNTAIMLKCQELAKQYDFRWQSRKYNHNREKQLNENIHEIQNQIKRLFELGGDLNIENRYNFNCYSTSRNLKSEEKTEMEEFLASLIKKKTKWKFWK